MTEPSRLLGIHHVTAIAGDPQENAEFYVHVLGMRLVKVTVNQDDPGTYHLFYADDAGNPGTDLTFFAWPGGRHGREGTGQATRVALAMPEGSVPYWMQRLRERDVSFEGPSRRFDEQVLAMSDFQGFPLELIASADAERRQPWAPWRQGPVPAEHAIRGIHNVTLREAGEEPTVTFLTAMGFVAAASEGERTRYTIGDGGSGAMLDLVIDPGAPRGQIAVASIHHVAWRTPDAMTQQQWRARLRSQGVSITDVIDRFWFKSIYFRERGGVLFEIATDGPGFTADQRREELGTRLILPPWLEPHRTEIEAALPQMRLSELAARPG